jgi:hypothetical protein
VLLYAAKYLRSSIILAIVMLVTPAYMIVRIEGWWHGEQLVEISRSIDEERAISLQGRLDDEELLIERASEKSLWGWGGWNRWRVTNEWGEKLTSSDGMWVIARGERGDFGLIANNLVVLLPFILLLLRVPAGNWASPMYAAPAALAMLLLLWSIDNLFNAMHNPIYIIAAGGLSGLYLAYPQLMARYGAMQRQYVAMMMARQQAMIQQQRAMGTGRLREPQPAREA